MLKRQVLAIISVVIQLRNIIEWSEVGLVNEKVVLVNEKVSVSGWCRSGIMTWGIKTKNRIRSEKKKTLQYRMKNFIRANQYI